MSIMLFAKLGEQISVSEIFKDVESFVPSAARVSLRIVGESSDPASIQLAPFPVAEYERDGRRYKEDFATWDRTQLEVAAGMVACVGISVSYRASLDDSEVGTYQPTEAERSEDPHRSGYHVCIDAGILRTKASFCLGVLLAAAIARRSGARVQDESGHLSGREWVELALVFSVIARHSGATSFEAFADCVCNDIGFAPNWPDSATLSGTDLTAR